MNAILARRKPINPRDWLETIDDDYIEIRAVRKRPIGHHVRVTATLGTIDLKRSQRRTAGQPTKAGQQQMKASMHQTSYPPALIRWFIIGLFTFLAGLAAIVIAAFVHIDALNITASALLVIGSAAVAITLLRGQDLEERAN